MFDHPVLGVDPGTASMGLALVAGDSRRPRVEWAITVRTPPGAAALRLSHVFRAVTSAIADRSPRALAMERLLWGRNTGSAMEVARASGAVMVAAAEAGVTVHEYAPLEVKMAVAGVGNAPKDQVRRALSRLFAIDGLPDEPDAVDAVAVAVCHLVQSPLRSLSRAADAT